MTPPVQIPYFQAILQLGLGSLDILSLHWFEIDEKSATLLGNTADDSKKISIKFNSVIREAVSSRESRLNRTGVRNSIGRNTALKVDEKPYTNASIRLKLTNPRIRSGFPSGVQRGVRTFGK
jgi:hypothetical protein